MLQIHFIVNPIAGNGNTIITTEYLSTFFETNIYQIIVKITKYKKHAIELTLDSINEGASIIVACGGDGTVNEVASCLVNKDIVLGILSIGSGNGLASNLNIPKKIDKAIELIKLKSIKQIDVGCFNDLYFFSNAGIGFDAKVVKHYEDSGVRRLYSYIKASLKTINDFKYENLIEVDINQELIELRHFMIFISNSNELGYKVSLTPKASLQDGLLDVLIISKLSKIKTILFGVLMLLKKHFILKEVRSIQTKSLTLTRKEGAVFFTQLDGEYHAIADKNIVFNIKEKSLNVIA
jgi:YegS/Rv2252/BmrU family lipid kinase